MYSLEELSIADLSGIICHCFERETDLMSDQRGMTDDEVEDKYYYYRNVSDKCKEELEKRLKQISFV